MLCMYVCPAVLGRINSVLHIALCATTCDSLASTEPPHVSAISYLLSLCTAFYCILHADLMSSKRWMRVDAPVYRLAMDAPSLLDTAQSSVRQHEDKTKLFLNLQSDSLLYLEPPIP
jgi:hypothetical protein